MSNITEQRVLEILSSFMIPAKYGGGRVTHWWGFELRGHTNNVMIVNRAARQLRELGFSEGENEEHKPGWYTVGYFPSEETFRISVNLVTVRS